MKCPECGKRFRGNFCPECGWRVRSAGPESPEIPQASRGKKLLGVLCCVLTLAVAAQGWLLFQLKEERDEYEFLYRSNLGKISGYDTLKEKNQDLRDVIEKMRGMLFDATGETWYFEEEY